MLNFLLAIIVDAYGKVVEQLESCTVEQDFPNDVWCLIRYCWASRNRRSFRSSWPARSEIIYLLTKCPAVCNKKYIGADDFCALHDRPDQPSILELCNRQRTRDRKAKVQELVCYFEEESDAEAYCNFYKAFPFLINDNNDDIEEVFDDSAATQAMLQESCQQLQKVVRMAGLRSKTSVDEAFAGAPDRLRVAALEEELPQTGGLQRQGLMANACDFDGRLAADLPGIPDQSATPSTSAQSAQMEEPPKDNPSNHILRQMQEASRKLREEREHVESVWKKVEQERKRADEALTAGRAERSQAENCLRLASEAAIQSSQGVRLD